MKRAVSVTLSIIVVLIAVCGAVPSLAQAKPQPPLQHPYLILNASELTAIMNHVNAGDEPWASAWDTQMIRVNQAMAGTPTLPPPVTWVGAPTYNTTPVDMAKYFTYCSDDGSAARNLALAYCITGDVTYADKAIEYLMAWAQGYTPVTYNMMPDDNGDPAYLQSYGLFKFAWAYDLLANQTTLAQNQVIVPWLQRCADAEISSALAAAWPLSHWLANPAWNAYGWTTALTYYQPDEALGGNFWVFASTAAMACAEATKYTADISYLLDQQAVTTISPTSDWWGGYGAFDGYLLDTDHRWQAASGFPQWLKLDLLDATHTTTGIRIHWYDNTRAWKYKIESSIDNVSWTKLVDKSANTAKGDVSLTWASQAMRCLRVNVTGCSPTGGSAAIVDATVYDGAGQPIRINLGGFPQQINTMLNPRNQGDGVAAHGATVPAMYVYQSYLGSGRGALDYSTYNARVAYTDLFMGRALNRLGYSTEPSFNQPAYVTAVLNQWRYFRRFFGQGYEADPIPGDKVNPLADVPRFVVPLWLSTDASERATYRSLLIWEGANGHPDGSGNADPYPNYYEPQFLGPMTLLFWRAD